MFTTYCLLPTAHFFFPSIRKTPVFTNAGQTNAEDGAASDSRAGCPYLAPVVVNDILNDIEAEAGAADTGA